jgi:DNA primase
LAGKPGAGPGQEPFQQPYDGENPAVQVERELLKLAVQRPVLCGPDFDALDAGAFTAPAHNAVRELIAHAGGMGAAQAGDGGAWAARLRDAAPGEAARAFVTRLAVEPLRLNGEADARYAGAVLARVGELDVSRQIVVLKSRLQRLNPVEDQAEYNRTFGDLVALEQRRKVLWERAVGAL